MHVIYSSDIIMDTIFRNAFGDAIDIDVSENVKHLIQFLTQK